MNQNKTLMTLAIASIALLLVACVGFFWVAWSSMSSVEQLREENHRLMLESTVCSLRLANSTGGASYSVPESKPDVPVVAPESVLASSKSVKPQTAKPALGTVGSEPVKAAMTEPVKAVKTEPVKAVKSEAASAAALVNAPVPKAAQVPVKTPEAAPTVQLTAKAPVAIDPAKRVWAVQAGAFRTNEDAEDGALEVRDALKRAGMEDLPVLVGKGKGASFWKIYVEPCATFQDAEKARERLMPVLKADLFSTRLPKSLREAVK